MRIKSLWSWLQLMFQVIKWEFDFRRYNVSGFQASVLFCFTLLFLIAPFIIIFLCVLVFLITHTSLIILLHQSRMLILLLETGLWNSSKSGSIRNRNIMYISERSTKQANTQSCCGLCRNYCNKLECLLIKKHSYLFE